MSSVTGKGTRGGWADGGGRRRRVAAREEDWGKVRLRHQVSLMMESRRGGKGAQRRGVGSARWHVRGRLRRRMAGAGGARWRGDALGVEMEGKVIVQILFFSLASTIPVLLTY